MSVDKLPRNQESGPTQPSSLEAGGGPPYDGGMESRIQGLEADVAAIKEDLAVLRANSSHYATKADLNALATNLIKWMVGTAIGFDVAAVTVMTFVLNNAIPKATPTPAVIYLPYPPQQYLPALPQAPSQK